MNLSLSSGDISGLKESVITPILKKSGLDKNDLANYRPIVNLQFLSKVIEKVLLNRLTSHMTSNNLHCHNQFGYKKHHSTETMLLQIVNDVLIRFEEKSGTILILLDMSSAFDTVDIKKLLGILEQKIMIKGTALKWFQSFLLNRKQKVMVNGKLSEILLTLYGVPQDSVLGPVLFNIYLRSIYKLVESHGFNIKGFADDHQLYVSFVPLFQSHYLGEKINCILNEVTLWMNTYFLKLNAGKTQMIVFGPSSIRNDVTINGIFIDYNNTCIRFRNVVKNLGVFLDSDMSYAHQINSCVSSVFLTIKSISKISSFLSKKEKCTLVCSLVLSKLDYCNSLYYGTNAILLKKTPVCTKLCCTPYLQT